MPRELLSRKTRIEFREVLVGWTLREIRDEFEGEYISCRLDYDPKLSGERRTLVEQYYATLDFTRWNDIQRLLRVYEDILNTMAPHNPEIVEQLTLYLRRDGFEYSEGKIQSVAFDLPTLGLAESISLEFSADYMSQQIRRIESSIEDDPDLAVGSAKELVETCCKTILLDRGMEIPKKLDVTKLVRLTMKELSLLPDDIPDAAKGADSIKRLLSNLATVTQGLTEVRNLYGSGHGRHGRASSLRPRHAKLAVGAATTLVVFLFETHRETFEPKFD